jgi:hypothetical protein
VAEDSPLPGGHAVERHSAPASAAPGAGLVALLMAYLMLGAALLLYSLGQLLPLPTPAGAGPQLYTPVVWLAWTMQVSDEVRLFWLVALAGALGGLVHTLRSFYWYVGNRVLMRHWLPMYFLLPFVGSSISLVFYLVIRGGFFSPQASVQQTSPFGFVALAGIIGMFSPQAVLKLQQIAETVLTKPESGEDAKPQQTAADGTVQKPPGVNGTSGGVPAEATPVLVAKHGTGPE